MKKSLLLLIILMLISVSFVYAPFHDVGEVRTPSTVDSALCGDRYCSDGQYCFSDPIYGDLCLYTAVIGCSEEGDCGDGYWCIYDSVAVHTVCDLKPGFCEDYTDCESGYTCIEGECFIRPEVPAEVRPTGPATVSECSAPSDCGSGEACVLKTDESDTIYGECQVVDAFGGLVRENIVNGNYCRRNSECISGYCNIPQDVIRSDVDIPGISAKVTLDFPKVRTYSAGICERCSADRQCGVGYTCSSSYVCVDSSGEPTRPDSSPTRPIYDNSAGFLPYLFCRNSNICGGGICDQFIAGPTIYDPDGLRDLSSSEDSIVGFCRASLGFIDTDGDGLSDREEERLETNPKNTDSDDDGLSDGVEVFSGTNPNNPDHDGDGSLDGEDGDPLDPNIIGMLCDDDTDCPDYGYVECGESGSCVIRSEEDLQNCESFGGVTCDGGCVGIAQRDHNMEFTNWPCCLPKGNVDDDCLDKNWCLTPLECAIEEDKTVGSCQLPEGDGEGLSDDQEPFCSDIDYDASSGQVVSIERGACLDDDGDGLGFMRVRLNSLDGNLPQDLEPEECTILPKNFKEGKDIPLYGILSLILSLGLIGIYYRRYYHSNGV